MAPFVQGVTVTVSIFSLTVIAIDRQRAMIHPLRPRLQKSAAYIVICSLWLCGIIISLPQAIALRVMQAPSGVGEATKPFCYPVNMPLQLYKQYLFSLVILQYVVPLGIISLCYYRIGRHLWWGDAALQDTEASGQEQANSVRVRNKKKVLCAFILCQRGETCRAHTHKHYANMHYLVSATNASGIYTKW